MKQSKEQLCNALLDESVHELYYVVRFLDCIVLYLFQQE